MTNYPVNSGFSLLTCCTQKKCRICSPSSRVDSIFYSLFHVICTHCLLKCIPCKAHVQTRAVPSPSYVFINPSPVTGATLTFEWFFQSCEILILNQSTLSCTFAGCRIIGLQVPGLYDYRSSTEDLKKDFCQHFD